MKVFRNWRFITFVLFALLIGIGILAFIKESNTPAQGTVKTETIPGNPNPAPPKLTATTGKYISFKYPDNFRKQPGNKPSGVVLENFNFVTKTIPYWNMSVNVESLPSGNLLDNSSYSVRLQDPNHYQPSTVYAGGRNFPIFSSSTGGYEEVAFVQNGTKVALVSVTTSSGNQNEELQTAVKAVLANLTWH